MRQFEGLDSVFQFFRLRKFIFHPEKLEQIRLFYALFVFKFSFKSMQKKVMMQLLFDLLLNWKLFCLMKKVFNSTKDLQFELKEKYERNWQNVAIRKLRSKSLLIQTFHYLLLFKFSYDKNCWWLFKYQILFIMGFEISYGVIKTNSDRNQGK